MVQRTKTIPVRGSGFDVILTKLSELVQTKPNSDFDVTFSNEEISEIASSDLSPPKIMLVLKSVSLHTWYNVQRQHDDDGLRRCYGRQEKHSLMNLDSIVDVRKSIPKGPGKSSIVTKESRHSISTRHLLLSESTTGSILWIRWKRSYRKDVVSSRSRP